MHKRIFFPLQGLWNAFLRILDPLPLCAIFKNKGVGSGFGYLRQQIPMVSGKRISEKNGVTCDCCHCVRCCSLLFKRSMALRLTEGSGLAIRPWMTGMKVSVGIKALTWKESSSEMYHAKKREVPTGVGTAFLMEKTRKNRVPPYFLSAAEPATLRSTDRGIR